MLGKSIDNEKLEIAKKLMQHQKKLAVPFAIAAGACTLGAGMFFDKIRNNKARQAATDIATGNIQNVYANNGEIGVSANGVPYYKSANGVKYGALTGAACGAVQTVMNSVSEKAFNIGGLIVNMAVFSLGGIIMGAISQKAANKAAERKTYMT